MYKRIVVSHCRLILVVAESLISGHKLVRIRERLGDKLEFISFDPLGKWLFIHVSFLRTTIFLWNRQNVRIYMYIYIHRAQLFDLKFLQLWSKHDLLINII